MLPHEYDVIGSDGAVNKVSEPVLLSAPIRPRQEWVFNDVWRRRVNYFCIVAISSILLLLPLI